MPYFSHSMASSIQSGAQSQPTSKRLRSMPGNAPNGSSVVSRDSEPSYRERYHYEVQTRKLLFMRSLIRAQVQQILLGDPAYSTDSPAFGQYTIDRSCRVYQDTHLKMFRATCSRLPNRSLMVRMYPRKEVDPSTSLYLKILRHLGKKHHKVVFTFDLFADSATVFVFQEYIEQGNMVEYLDTRPATSERQAQFWAKQVYDALDFLGDQAIAHRNITPHHLLVLPTGHEIWVKLSGFQSAIIYFDTTRNDVFYVPCRPAENHKSDGPNFQAPEVYGNPDTEDFDPILADTWSYGANVYYMLAKTYPYNLDGHTDDLDSEIWANIRNLHGLSGDGQEFLYSALRTNSNNRIPFDFIGRNRWLDIKSVSTQAAVIQTPYKTLEKVKVGQSKSGSGRSTTSKASSFSPLSNLPLIGNLTQSKSASSSSSSSSSKSGRSKMKSKVKVKVKSKSQTKR